METVKDTLHHEQHGKSRRSVMLIEQKKKRVYVEWRKLCCRMAAQSRRSKESQLFKELAALLPLDSRMDGHRDKASVIRLTIAFLHLRALLNPANPTLCSTMTAGVETAERKLMDSAVGGFVVLLSLNGTVIFATKDVTRHLGINQMDLIGKNLLDILHPCDQTEVKNILTTLMGRHGQQKCEVYLRVKSTGNQKQTPWKVIHCTGKKRWSASTSCLVLWCRVLPMRGIIETNAEINLSTFLSIHRPDMKFLYCHSRVRKLTGFYDTELVGRSAYQFYHPSDCQQIHKAHVCLLSKGQMSTGKYRLLHRHGGYVWAETDASLVCNSRTGAPESVVCINYILSGVEEADFAFLLDEADQLLKSFVPLGEPASHETSDPHYDTLTTTEAKEEVDVYEGDTQKTEAFCSPTCDLCDLECLAPYIPMHGEDFLLSPILDSTVSHSDKHDHAMDLDHQFSEPEPWLIVSDKRPVKSFQFSNRICSSNLTLKWPNSNPNVIHKACDTRLTTTGRGSIWMKDLKVSLPENSWIIDGHNAPIWKLNPIWLAEKAQQEVASAQWRGEKAKRKTAAGSLVLPVLSRRECEINAPLDPKSDLLQGTEITAVLDQAASRVLWF